ncbi:putative toxin subunit protein [Botrytis fragariae]|uniref:Putative toxin subunit protein n=1 Tax=Botrytis fragariae TaxID=1964551 RepID=A0A8H6AV31_9HELO|nr:putative toxin subunit protein [Botrytis fragariae]KAF5874209.1 putative toxin subunit protein [Botrytis fragariae]
MPLFIEAIDSGLLPGDLRERLNHASELWPGDPRSAIDWFLEGGNIPTDTIVAMTFVRSLLFYFDDEEYVCGQLLTLLSSYTLEGLASLLFPRSLLDQKVTATPANFPYNWTTTNLTIAKLEEVRAEFLDNHSLIVLLILLREGKFSIKERPQQIADCILTAMIGDELEIGSLELLVYVKKAFPDLKDAEFSAAIEFIKTLKILSSLVEDPEDVVYLYNSNYHSVRSITAQSKSNFKNSLVTAGTSVESSLKIYDCAERVDCWNEQLWLHLMNSRRADSVMIDPYFEGEITNVPSDESWMGKSHNNLTDIFRLEDTTCEECCSITSLSAYFADLLSLLSNTTPTGTSPQYDDPPGTRNSLLNILSQRRPDLRNLELTCANSQTLIPYISLVNEVLESFIRHKCLGSPDSIRVFNTPIDAQDDEHSPTPLNLPGNTDYEVYSKIISKQRFPFTSFPYDQARNMVLSYFDIFQVAHCDFVDKFQAPETILQTIKATTTDEVKRSLSLGAKEVLERQRAAETLGLHQMEFAAITGESFYPQIFSDLLKGLSSDSIIDTRIQEHEFCQMWGYEDDETMLGAAEGLTQIKDQLMQRSGLEFQDVLDLVKTQLFDQQLVITNEAGSNEFTESLAELRLLSNASSPPFQPLTSNICRNIQSFLRLKARLGWSTKVLDAAIHCLRNREMESSPSFRSNTVSQVASISVYVIKGIASIVKLSDLCGLEPAALVPLWGLIDSFGDESLLHRKFLSASLGEIFAVPKDGAYFQPGGKVVKIQECGASICASLNWRFEYINDLLEATNLANDDLNIETFSILYRYVTICRMLSVPPKYCVPFFKIFFDREDPLANPNKTLSTITNWTTLLNSGWTIETLVLALGKPASDESSITGGNPGQKLTGAILDGTKDLRKSLSSLFNGAIPTHETIVECAARTFDSITASLVVEFVEGSQIRTTITTLDTQQNLQSLINKSKNWSAKISVIPSSTANKWSAQFKLAGILTANEKQQILDGCAEFPTPSPSVNDISIEAEAQVQARRAAFVEMAKPVIVQDTLTTSILNTMKDLVEGVDITVLSTLLTDTVKVSTNENSALESAMAALKQLSVPVEIMTNAKTLDAYFTPMTTDDFKLHYTGALNSTISLMINGIEVPFDTNSKTWSAFRMNARQPYLLKSSIPPSQISWSTCRSMTTPFTDEELQPSTSIQRATLILEAIQRAVCICQAAKLTTSELEYIDRAGKTEDEMLSMNLNTPSLMSLVQLQEYRELRDNIMIADSDLISLFSWLYNPKNPDVKTIATKIAASTGWKDTLVESVLNAKYPNHTPADLVAVLRNHDSFVNLRAILAFYEGLGSASDVTSKPLMTELFYLAKPLSQLNSGDTYMEAAKNLQKRLTPSQREASDEGLMESQRKTLVAYLLQQKFITQDLGIWDADGLFEYFLVDVQMGPQIRTSRIKTAISVVQMFVQRCLLGMEEGVSKSVLGHEKWDWLQQYTLWEVHRKIFLYPENWIDPSLRDDKSELFDQFEATLMQKDLSIKTFLQAIQSYLYDLDGISSLDIVAYVHEPQPAASDIFHLFGRTRSGPYTFYYRTLTRLRTAEVFWQPWSKVEVDIASIETEWEGQRLVDTGSYLLPIMIKGRLYLFMPSIVPKTLVKNISSMSRVTTFDALRNENPNLAEPVRIWEITMAWTEFVNDTWAPKRVSSGSLSVGLEASSAQLRVDPTLQDNTLTLQVSYGEAGKTTSKAIGSFIFCNDQISTSNTVSTSTKTGSFATYFQKALKQGMDLESLPGGSKYTNSAPLIWVPPELESTNGASDVCWTLSKLPQRVTGLVVSAKVSEGRRASFFNIPKMELLSSTWTKDVIKNNTELVSIDHIFSHELMEATADRIDPLRCLYNKIAQLPAGVMRESFGAGSHEAWYHELGRPTALYNWEVGLHTVLLAVDRFSATQQYEEALEVARLVFDPSADLELNVDDKSTYRSCWRFPPFQEMARQIAIRGETSFDPLNLDHLSKEIQLAIKERRSYGSLVHAAARGRPISYMKWIVMKYAEILIAMGDVYFRRASLESLPIATQRYIEAARVLGQEPPKVPDLGKRKRKAMTFEQLREEDIMYDSVVFDLGLPFSAKLKKGAAEIADRDPKKENIACFLRTNYFCAPLNPKFKQMRSLVHERLYNLRNSFDIQGKPVVYGLREPPIDPGALIALSKGGMGVSDILSMVSGERNSPLPRQRFDALLKQALALCTEVRKLSGRLVAVVEKKEMETFNIGNAQHASVIQKMMLDIKNVELEEAQQTVESLLINRSSLEAQLNYYLQLIGEPDSMIPKPKDNWVDIQQSIDTPTQDELRMSSYEKAEMTQSLSAGAKNRAAVATDALSIPLYLVPQATTNFEPLGVGGSISFAGSSIADAVAAGSTLARGIAAVLVDEAGRADKKASLTMQLRERRLAANMSGREIKSIDKQVEIQKIHITSIQKDIEIQQSEIEDAAGAEEWYRTKYTSEQLYTWMEKIFRNLYFQAYELSMTMALRAESSFNFEAGSKSSIINKGGYWNPSQDGLLAAESLYLDLRRLESAQLDCAAADYNISKSVSLKDFDPMALMKLRITGTTDFSIGELLYDMDFPGHYMRRIRSVSVSVPSDIETGTNTNAVLTLLEHKYRVTQNAADYAASQSATGSESFRTDRIPITAIAVSSGAKDPGVFELDFSGPRYMPFEGAGAISAWRLEFPAPIRHFNYESITDVQLHIQYTAYEGGPTLRKAAKDAVVQAAQSIEAQGQHQGYWALWDLKTDFAAKWVDFGKTLLTTNVEATLDLGNLKDRLPFWSRHQKDLQVQSFTLMSRNKNVRDRLSISVDPNSPAYNGTDGIYSGDLFTRKCDMTEKNLNWKLKAKAVPVAAVASENVYLFVRYIYVGKDIS